MTFRVTGVKQLNARIDAMKPDLKMMETLGLEAVAEQKRLVPRVTGNLGRSIHIARVGKSFVETEAGADYSAYVEYGTGAHTIRPVRARALRWKIGGGYAFARFVRHPGTKAQPYMEPGAKNAVEKLFGARSRLNIIVRRWDRAA